MQALDQGYKSVAHYLVATRRAPPTTPPALNQSAIPSPVASTGHYGGVSPKSSPSSPASVITNDETKFLRGVTVSQKDRNGCPPVLYVSEEEGLLDCPSPESVNAAYPANDSDTLNRKFAHVSKIGRKRKAEIGSPGGSSCESGLSSEAVTVGKGEILERKFRSLVEITSGTAPVKRRRGARARESCRRFVDFV